MMIFLCAAALVAFVGAIIDFKTGHIPNALTLGALVAALIAHVAYGAWMDGASGALSEGGRALFGMVACAAVPLLMYAKGGMGGGDVKLFAAIGALALPLAGLEAQTYTFVAALLIAPARLAYDGTLFRTLKNAFGLLLNPMRKKETRTEVPEELKTWFRLGPSIFIGVLATLLTHWDPQ